MSGQLQVNLIPCRDFLYQLGLEHLKPAAQTDNNTAPHGFRGLLKKAERSFGGMGRRKSFKQAVQFRFRIQRQQPVDLTDVLMLCIVALVHIQHQRFKQVHFGGIPEVVALAAVHSIFDDNIYEKLRHQFLSLDFRKAVPGVAVFWRDQIENTDTVTLVPQIGT